MAVDLFEKKIKKHVFFNGDQSNINFAVCAYNAWSLLFVKNERGYVLFMLNPN